MPKRLALLLTGLLTTAGLVLLTPASPAHAADKDCSDFASQAAAQKYFLAHGGPKSDPDRLDADHDGIACESDPGPYDYSTTPTGGGNSSHSHPAKQHSRITVKKIKHGAHGWKIVASVKKNGKAWSHTRTVVQAKLCGSYQTVLAKKTGPGGRATFLFSPEKGWNNEKECGVKNSRVPVRIHVAKQGGVPAANSRTFHLTRR